MTESSAVAVVGVACRVPGAGDVDGFWANLVAGRDCVTREYGPGGELIRAGGVVDDLEGFDTHLFRMSAREAALLDPQHRMFLECCWAALESAGLPPASLDGLVGLFGGVGLSSYLINNVLPGAGRRSDRTFVDSSHDLQLLLAADKEYLSSRVAYRLDLRGPVMTVQAACATGLFAVHLAVQSLLNGECDLALAGAASASVPQLSRHRQEPGMVLSTDGYCRSYDAAASGTVFGSGAGVVVLKLLEDAERDGDPILGVIRGSAVGNDGANKIGMTAPSIGGQAAVIADALAVAGLEPADISYVEGHGTATPVGDPIEVAALNRVFTGCRPGSIGLGSVKTNIGHLGTAAGMAGFIKTLLCLHHGVQVPTLHFESPHPDAQFDEGPFAVVTELRPWPQHDDGAPRRAGVSAFGLGGANAHVVLEEYVPDRDRIRPDPAPAQPTDRRWHCIPLSAASPDAVRQGAAALLRATEDPARAVEVADVATTLAHGREHLPWRVGIVARDRDDLARALDQVARNRRAPGHAPRDPKLGMLFTGYFPESLGLRELVTAPPVRAIVEAADPVLLREVGTSASDVLVHGRGDGLVTKQVAQFVLQAALFELWRAWGVRPDTVVGHSLGEFAAAYAAGVLDVEGAVRMVAARSRLLESLPDGRMAVLGISAAEVAELVDELGVELSIGAVNGPANTVVSGPAASVEAISARVEAGGGRTKQLGYGTAGHSAAVDAVVDRFAELIQDVPMNPPTLPVVSTVTGAPIGDEIGRPGYWVRQLRNTVQFAAAMASLERMPLSAYLEVGPAPVLSGMYAAAYPESTRALVPSQRPGVDSWETMLGAVAALYEQGFPVDWAEITRDTGGVRRQLPGYSFDRTRHWIDAPEVDETGDDRASEAVDNLLYRVSWERDETPEPAPAPRGHWIVLDDATGTSRAVTERLRAAGHLVLSLDEVDLPADDDAWTAAVVRLLDDPPLPVSGVLSFAALDFAAPTDLRSATTDAVHRNVLLLQAVTRCATGPYRTWLFTRGAVAARPGETPCPAQAGVAAMARSAVREFPRLPCLRVDLDGGAGGPDADVAAVADVLARPEEADVAYRDGTRLVRRLVRGERPTGEDDTSDPAGTYLVTGGLSDLGALTAAVLLRRGAERVVLVGRTDDGDERRSRVRDTVAGFLGDASHVDRVVFDYADVTDAAAVDALVARHDTEAHPLRGVVHAAGLLDDATLGRQTRQRLETALSVKAFGALNLDLATRRCRSLEMFTCFTSATGVVGNAGQANYAAANAFVEALADTRVAQGLPGQCLAWGPWSEIGHLARDQVTRTALVSAGMGGLSTADGERALSLLLGRGTGTTAILTNSWEVWRNGSNALEERSFRALVTATRTAPEPSAEPEPDRTAGHLSALLADGDVDTARKVCAEAVAAAVAEVLGTLPAGDDQLRELGLDSLSAVQLRNRLARTFDMPLPVDICLRKGSVDALADHVVEQYREVYEHVRGAV